MDSQKFVREGVQDNKSEIDPAIYRLFKKMMVEILSEQAEASCGKAAIEGETPVTFPMNKHSDIAVQETLKLAGAATRATNAATWESIRGQRGKCCENHDRLLQNSPQQKGKKQEGPKRKDWSKDRDFTPLDEPLDKVLECMLSNGLVRLPKAASPSTIMGKYLDQFCRFHRATGHDTEHCFDFKNIVQDCLDKNLFVKNEEEKHPDLLTMQAQSSSQKGVSTQQKSSKPKKAKHDGWGYDRKLTPLGQPIEEVLQYLLAKDMIKLPRKDDPSVTKGKWKDCFCKFHRARGHDTERCFVLKNIIQDYIDKELLVPEEKRGATCSSNRTLSRPLKELRMPKFFFHFYPFLSDHFIGASQPSLLWLFG